MERRVVRKPVKPNRRVTTKDIGLGYAEQTLQVKAELEKAGLYLPEKPEYEYPPLPEDPTVLSDAQLMEEFYRFTAWADYLGGQLGLTEVDERFCDAILDKTSDNALLRTMPSSEALRKREDTMTRVKAEVNLDPVVAERAQSLAVAYARRKLLKTMYDRAERDSGALSREITRRTDDNPRQRRARRYSP